MRVVENRSQYRATPAHEMAKFLKIDADGRAHVLLPLMADGVTVNVAAIDVGQLRAATKQAFAQLDGEETSVTEDDITEIDDDDSSSDYRPSDEESEPPTEEENEVDTRSKRRLVVSPM